jgi:hypothetical protein
VNSDSGSLTSFPIWGRGFERNRDITPVECTRCKATAFVDAFVPSSNWGHSPPIFHEKSQGVAFYTRRVMSVIEIFDNSHRYEPGLHNPWSGSIALLCCGMDELVHWLGRVQQLRRDFAAANRKRSV